MTKLDLGKKLTFTEHEALVAQGIWYRSQFPDRHKDAAKVLQREKTGWWAAHDYMSGMIGDRGSLFVLIGQRGTGKTQLATCVARLVAFHGEEVVYRRASDLYSDIKATFGVAEESEREVVRGMTTPRLLVIDEMQDRGGTAWEERILNQIVDSRYASHKDTILISNDVKEALVNSLGPSIMSRADEIGGIISTDWGSFRE